MLRKYVLPDGSTVDRRAIGKFIIRAVVTLCLPLGLDATGVADACDPRRRISVRSR